WHARNVASDDPIHAAYAEVERWGALAFYEPAAAAAQLAQAICSTISNDATIAARVRLGGLTSALAAPLAGNGELLAYAAGMEALEAGDLARAREYLEALGDREILVGGVTLRSARRVLEERGSQELTEIEVEAEPASSRVKFRLLIASSVDLKKDAMELL